MKNQTKAIHTPFARKDPFGAISMPVYNTVAYEFDDAQEMSDAFCYRKLSPDYSRAENPTVDYLEDKVKAITGAHDVIALNSGMAAISNIFLALTATGKNIVSSRHMFGNTYALINGSMKRFGVTAKLCDLTNRPSTRTPAACSSKRSPIRSSRWQTSARWQRWPTATAYPS